MATNLFPVRPVPISCSSSGQRKPDPTRMKTPSSSANWWAPIFGWSSEPDYIESAANAAVDNQPDPQVDPKLAKTRFARGCFTKEKARQLRMMTAEMETYHDTMYHSAIANRLATDFGNRTGL